MFNFVARNPWVTKPYLFSVKLPEQQKESLHLCCMIADKYGEFAQVSSPIRSIDILEDSVMIVTRSWNQYEFDINEPLIKYAEKLHANQKSLLNVWLQHTARKYDEVYVYYSLEEAQRSSALYTGETDEEEG